jgi:Cyclic nucleotide-binding domain/Histidine kinase-like ATPase domain
VDTVTLISSNTELFLEVQDLVKRTAGTDFRSVQLKEPGLALDFLSSEMPELALIDCCDPTFDAFELLHGITVDPWLFHGGIIALYEEYECLARIEDAKGANIVATIMREDLGRQLPTIMRVVWGNRRILYQRDLGADLVWNISGSFKLANDPIEAACFANLVSNFLCSTNRVSVDKKPVLTMSIYEMLVNAIEHGNCGITYSEKSALLEHGKDISELIEEKCKDPAVAAKRVTFDYTFLPDCARFSIADEGEGFDWRGFVESKRATDVTDLHGRGIFMTKGFTRNLRYNDSGNEVSFEVVYQQDKSAVMPGLFKSMECRDVEEGRIVFKYGEPSDFLYYIVKGQYDVMVNDKVISSLSPDDIFMGEMSFLLNNRRSATVTARTPGKLIRISKKDFVEAIRRKPQYALFLSRLLAQRIQRQNERAFTPV